MDELFRRAADDYPLNTDNALWSDVEAKLLSPPIEQTARYPKKKYKRLFWLLLLPIGFIGGIYVSNYSGNHKAAPTKTILAVPRKTTNTATGKQFQKLESSTLPTPAKKTAAAITNATSPAQQFLVPLPPEAAVKVSGIHKPAPTTLEKNIVTKQPLALSTVATVKPSTDASTKTTNAYYKKAVSEHSLLHSKNMYHLKQKTPGPEAVNNTLLTRTNGLEMIKDTLLRSVVRPKNTKTLYATLLFGPDVSTVKYKQLSKAGYSVGVVLGYAFGKSLAVEAGIMLDEKHYYSEGEYLDTTKLHLPAHSTVDNLIGTCSMLEIPINIKYAFTQHRRWFVSSGLSTYIMKSENYDLYYRRYSTAYEKNYTYTNSTTNWLAIFNVSVGYQQAFTNGFKLSVAPYMRMPLTGVGIGKLPINSTGVLIGLSHTIK